MTNKAFDDRVAVVTGASRGIGYATALKLAENGAHVIAIARTIGGLEELDDAIKTAGGTVTLMPLDLTDLSAVSGIGNTIAEKFDHVDIIVGNAGMLGKLMPVANSKPELFHDTMTLNVVANYHLIRALHPLFKKSNDPRAIFLTAADKYLGNAYWGIYGTSKAALNAMVQSYAAENPDMMIKTVFPGATKTAMMEQAFPGKVDDIKGIQTTGQAADTVLNALLS